MQLITLPSHIGIILDGNRRFSKRLMQEPWKGHEYGAKKVEMVLEWMREFDIKEITFYAFSYENFNRPKVEITYLMKLFTTFVSKLLKDKRLDEHQICVKFIGSLERFSKGLREKMLTVMEKTKKYNHYFVNFAMAYGGRIELVDACKKIAQKVKQGKLLPQQITEDVFASCLYVSDSCDLIIRTGGEKRLSNFLPWQGTYAELIFLDKFWPEFSKEDFVSCLEEYGKRQRRFGT